MIFKRSWSKSIYANSILLLISFVFIGGCAHDMALKKGQEKIDISEKSIALLSVTLSNQNKPDRQLDLDSIMVCPGRETCWTRKYLHKIEDPYKSVEDKYNEYLLSFELEARNTLILC